MLVESVKSLVGAAAASLLLAGSVSATSLSLEYLGPASDYRIIRVKESPVDPIGDGALPDNVLAGAFEMRDNTPNSSFETFIAWCLDVSHWLGTGTGVSYAYESTNTPFSNSYGLDADQQARVQDFFDANYYEGLENNRNKSGAFQMGLWEVLYDDDYSLINNDPTVNDEFRGKIGNDNTRRHANNYLLAASSYAGGQRWNLTFLESQSGQQNLVTVSAVPLPAAGLLLIGGLAGLGLTARRRRRS